MKTLIGLLSLLSGLAHAAPLSWPESAIKKIESAKTIKDLACVSQDSIAGQELCESFAKSYGLKNNVKIKRISESVLIMKSGAGSYKLERTDAFMRFLINDRVIDLNKYPNQERLGFAIEAALRPQSAGLAIIDRAYAAEIDPSVKPAVQALLVTVGQDGNCDAYMKLIQTCNSNLDQIFAYLKDKKPAKQAKMTKAIREKVEAVTAQLSKADVTLNSQYGSPNDKFDSNRKFMFGSALNCDCKEDNTQHSCTEEARKALFGQLPFLDRNNMTVPRQKGMDYCHRFLKEVIALTDIFGVRTETLAKKILDQVEGNVAKIKQEASDAGTKK